MRTAATTAVFGLMLVAACAVAGKERYYAPGQVSAMPLVADGPGDTATEQLIKDLGSDDWRTREQAGRDLAQKGEKALPFMRRALNSTDNPEVQRRLSVLVRKLDHDRLVSPKRVTFSAKDRTPKQIFEEIARQTGYKIDFGEQSDTKLSFEFADTPFWQAVDTVANKIGFTAYTDYEDSTVRVYNQDAMNPHVAYAGPFRFLATNISCNRNVQLSGISKRGGGERINEYLNLNFQVQSEPKNPMLGVSQAELLVATDNLGGSLVPPRERNDFEYRSGYFNRGGRSHTQSMGVNLTRADRGATTIKALKGRVRIELLSGTSPELVIADPLKVQKKAFTGRTADLELTSCAEDGNNKGTYVVSVTARNRTPVDPRRGDDYMWANNIQQRIELMDDKGTRYFSYGLQSSNHTPGGLQMVMMFGPENRRTGQAGPQPGAPAKLVLTEWHTVTHEVTFEFKDIPLP
ncbi:MAG TPA: HEAT repeat domain-containing protein [Gemmata sp.]